MPKVPAADATLRVLTLLAHRGPTPAQAIAAQLGLARSTVYQLLDALRAHGYVVHLAEERRYGLGVAAFELGGGFARQDPLARLGRPLLAELVDRVGESAHLAVAHGRDVLYIVEERAPRRAHLITGVGVRLPAHLTASGRAMLAALPRAQVRALYPSDADLIDRTGRGPATPSQLRAVLQATRARGYAIEDGEVTLGLRSVGAAVLDHNGWPVASVAVTFAVDPDLERDAAATGAVDAASARLAEHATAVAARLGRRIHAGRRDGGDDTRPAAR